MKYAFIALIAIYLVVYGCSPDSSEKATDSHETTAPATLEEAHQAEVAAVAADSHEPAAAAHAEQQKTADVVKEAVVEEPAVAAEVVEEVVVVVEEQQAAEVAETQLVVMPCGRAMARADIPENAPCLKLPPQTADTAYSKQDLNAVMQKMVETTNKMVLATRQLVIATQEVLNAGKEIIEAPEETQPAE